MQTVRIQAGVRTIIRTTFILAAAGLLWACGGGGGGGGAQGSAQLSMWLSRSTIDSGERTTVTTAIWDVDPLGIMLKYRYPTGLAWAMAAQLRVNEVDTPVSPTFIDATDGTDVYLVFFLSRSLFGARGEGDLIFDLRGWAAVEDGEVAVNADTDDPNFADSSQFDVNAPNFSEQDVESIEVIDN